MREKERGWIRAGDKSWQEGREGFEEGSAEVPESSVRGTEGVREDFQRSRN